MPKASLVVLQGGTHALAFERPDEVATLIQGHLGGGFRCRMKNSSS